MKSFINLQKGKTPRQAHRDLDGLKEDELGRDGFTGRAAQLYRRNDPTTFRSEGPCRVREVHVGELESEDLDDARGLPLTLFSNADCRIFLSRRSQPMPFFYRCLDGDEVFFVHTGHGVFETEFGPIEFEPGDYVVVPKAVTYRIVPGEEGTVMFGMETVGELTIPDYGLLGRHAPFDPTLLTIPEPQVLEGGGVADGEGRQEWEVRLRVGGELSSIFYPFHPCDVEGWKGDLFPFKLNIRDWNPVMSDSLHLPPTVHQFLVADGVMVAHFLPRPAEGRAGVERVPWYHRNADYDEVGFYHGGTFLGYELPKGMISHSPQGLHHGAPEIARELARKHHDDISRLDWQIIAFDTKRPLIPSAAVMVKDQTADPSKNKK